MSEQTDPQKVVPLEASRTEKPAKQEKTEETPNALEQAMQAAAARKRRMEEDRKRRNQRLADDTKHRR